MTRLTVDNRRVSVSENNHRRDAAYWMITEETRHLILLPVSRTVETWASDIAVH